MSAYAHILHGIIANLQGGYNEKVLCSSANRFDSYLSLVFLYPYMYEMDKAEVKESVVSTFYHIRLRCSFISASSQCLYEP